MLGDELIQRVLDWSQANRTGLYLLGALIVGYIMGRSRAPRRYSYQNRGEAAVSHVLQRGFGYPDYHLMNHVTLKMKDGTTQIDHILVSRFGVFVIETKDYNGWIFADARQAKWMQVLFYSRFQFQNPIFQNSRHVRAVQTLLDFVPPDTVKSVVVYTGKAEFRTGIPQGVVHISGLADYLRGHTVEVMTLNRVQFCVGRLETARLAISGQTDVEHIQSLERRYRIPYRNWRR